MTLYNANGNYNFTVADINSRGLYAPDGSLYVNIDSGYSGLYGPNGCLNVTTTTPTTQTGLHAPDGSLYASDGTSFIGRYAPGGSILAQGLFSVEASALFARFTTQPDVTRKTAIDNFIVSISSIWSKFDGILWTANFDSQSARQNWVQDAYNLTAFSSPVFTVDRGFTPDGAASYLDSGFNPTTAVAAKFLLNDAHMGVWHLTDLANAGLTSFDNGNTTSRLANGATGNTQPRPNNAQTTGIVENYAKHKVWTRSAAAVWEYYNSGVDTGGGTDASTALTSFAFGVGRTAAASFGLNQCALMHWGSNLTSGEVTTLYNAANTYMQAIGAV